MTKWVTMQFPDGVESITVYGTTVIPRPPDGVVVVMMAEVGQYRAQGCTVVFPTTRA